MSNGNNTVYLNQTDVVLIVETGIDLSTATVHNILYQKKDGTKGVWAGTVSGTKITYNAVAGDFNQLGVWNIQAFTTISGLDNYGTFDQIKVINNLK